MFWRTTPLLLLACISLQMQGCATTAVATGAATGTVMMQDRRTTGTIVEDETIELKALDLTTKDQEIWGQAHINTTSYNGIVLLTGETPTAAMRARMERLVRGINKVREIHNEITIAAPSSMLTRSSDTLITGKVKAKMLAEKDFNSIQIKVVTENGIIYLMGLVTRGEAEKATTIARSAAGVQKVVRLFEYID
ncbi:MAG: BON domain-containing protein [Gammaproteobacteria bacterium]|nr:BON domain-containing protein [Gammaproteobacteria bacterium]